MKAASSQSPNSSTIGNRLTLMYHNVTLPGDTFGRIGSSVTRYFVTANQFGEHLECLSEMLLSHSSDFSRTDQTDTNASVTGRSNKSALPGIDLDITFDDGWAGSFSNTIEALTRHNMRATVFVTTGLIGQQYFADEAMIRNAVATGRFTIGAHGVTHRLLETLSPQEIEREMFESKDTLENIIGSDVTTFALPGGSCSPVVRRTAKRLGYRELHNSIPAMCPVVETRPAFDIPRFAVQRTTSTDDIRKWLSNPRDFRSRVKQTTLDLAKSLLGRRRYANFRDHLLGSKNSFDMTDLVSQNES